MVPYIRSGSILEEKASRPVVAWDMVREFFSSGRKEREDDGGVAMIDQDGAYGSDDVKSWGGNK